MERGEYKKYQELTHVLLIDVSDEVSLKRISGRRICPKCQTVYHVDHKPSKIEGICDIDGEKLKIRKDDQPEAIRDRLNTYHTQTEPLIEFYQEQGILYKINGEQSIENVNRETQFVLGL